MNWSLFLAAYCAFIALFLWSIHHHNLIFHSGHATMHRSAAHFLLGGLEKHERMSQILSILLFTLVYWLLYQVVEMFASVLRLFGNLLRFVF